MQPFASLQLSTRQKTEQPSQLRGFGPSSHVSGNSTTRLPQTGHAWMQPDCPAAVQVGTANFVDPFIWPKLLGGITEYMRRHQINRIVDLVGTVDIAERAESL